MTFYMLENWNVGYNVGSTVRILVLFYTVNFTTYSSKVDYTYTCTKTRHNTLKTKFEGKKGFRL